MRKLADEWEVERFWHRFYSRSWNFEARLSFMQSRGEDGEARGMKWGWVLKEGGERFFWGWRRVGGVIGGYSRGFCPHRVHWQPMWAAHLMRSRWTDDGKKTKRLFLEQIWKQFSLSGNYLKNFQYKLNRLISKIHWSHFIFLCFWVDMYSLLQKNKIIIGCDLT